MENIKPTKYIVASIHPLDENKLNIQFNEVTFPQAVNAAVFIINQATSIELQNHPEFSRAYVDLLENLRSQINGIIKNHNKETLKFKFNARPSKK